MKRGKRCDYIFISKIRTFYMSATVLSHTEQHKRILTVFAFFFILLGHTCGVRGQPVRVGSLLAQCGSQGSNSGH